MNKKIIFISLLVITLFFSQGCSSSIKSDVLGCWQLEKMQLGSKSYSKEEILKDGGFDFKELEYEFHKNNILEMKSYFETYSSTINFTYDLNQTHLWIGFSKEKLYEEKPVSYSIFHEQGEKKLKIDDIGEGGSDLIFMKSDCYETNKNKQNEQLITRQVAEEIALKEFKKRSQRAYYSYGKAWSSYYEKARIYDSEYRNDIWAVKILPGFPNEDPILVRVFSEKNVEIPELDLLLNT